VVEENVFLSIRQGGSWEGALSTSVVLVHVQWQGSDGEWHPQTDFQPCFSLRPIMQRIEEILAAGEVSYTSYRLIPAKESCMQKVTKRSKSKRSPKRKSASKVRKRTAVRASAPVSEDAAQNGYFRAGSQQARLFKLMEDGRPHTLVEMAKHLGSTVSRVSDGALWYIRRKGRDSAGFKVVRTEEGYLLEL